jgi:hypothetical protein
VTVFLFPPVPLDVFLFPVGIGHALSLQEIGNETIAWEEFFVYILISSIFAVNLKPNT